MKTPILKMTNIVKEFPGVKALDGVNLELYEGKVMALMGENGAGKSTTMNMMTGFIEQTEGEIIINGYDITKKPKKAKKSIGYMPEGVPLYTDLTVKEFVNYMQEMKKLSEIPTADRDFTQEDRVVTLSTCTGNSATRFVVQGVCVNR